MDTGERRTDEGRTYEMHPALRAYLILGAATLVAAALVAAQAIILAPTTHFRILVLTNAFGEGIFEAVLVIAMLPAWVILARRLLARFI